jgi:6-phosphofructokinase
VDIGISYRHTAHMDMCVCVGVRVPGKVSAEATERCATLNIVGIVGSSDNDLCGTDVAIGTDSALSNIKDAINNIRMNAHRSLSLI